MSTGAWPYDWFRNALNWRAGVPSDLDEDSVWLAAAGSVISPDADPGWDAESFATAYTAPSLRVRRWATVVMRR